MPTNISDLKLKMSETIEHLNAEFRKLRAGRANPDLVKDIKVSAYGSMMPLNQVANINVADSTLLTVQPWDKTLTPEVVKAIQSSGIGINPAVDGDLIRLPIPPLTQERRTEYVKMMKQKAEEAKISIRQKRKEFLDDLDLEKEGSSEDEIKRKEKDLQALIDSLNKEIDDMSQRKEDELMQV